MNDNRDNGRFSDQTNPLNFREIWKDIKEAVAGTERDFTTTRLGQAIFILAVPMVLEMIMESVFAVVDIFFVSKLGANAVATVGITESVMTIVYAIGSGLSMATTALIARRIGEKDAKKAGLAAFQAILLALFVSSLISIPGIIWAKPFLRLMGASEEMISEGFMYPAIMFGSNGIVMLLFIINAVFRSSGDAAISMRVMWLANLINLVLDPLLIFGLGPIPALGIKGAAIATAIGRSIAVIYQFYLLFRRHHRIHLTRESLRFQPSIMLSLLKLSAGGILQNLIATSSWIFLVRIIAVFGASALAGYTIALRIIMFLLLPAWGLSNAAATLVGQNLGAGSPERAERSVWITTYINMCFMGLVCIAMIVWPESFIGIFIQDAEVIFQGASALRIISVGFIFYGLSMVMIQGFNGSGDTMTPSLINFVCFWIIEIPLAWILAIVLNMGLQGASLAIVIAESVLAVIALILFRRGKWKLRKV
jgi:putative MATE family efflux protein